VIVYYQATPSPELVALIEARRLIRDPVV